jgi:hypothetical protein
MHSPKPIAPAPVISESLTDLTTPGVIVALDPDAADRAGAFLDDALDEDAAWEANADL